MTCAALPLPAVATARPASQTLRLALLGSIAVSFLAGSSAPTPLYTVYQSLWHFSAATVTAIFASYVVILLAALLVFGRLSDHVGRKPLILAALALQVGAMAVFAFADGVAWLFAGRLLQGFATGAALGAIGAGMLDVDRLRGTIANAVTPALGTGLGAVASGLLVRFLPAPTQLVYALLALVYLLQAVAIARLPEPGQRRRGAWASLKPQISAPPAARAALRIAAPLLVAAWAMPGFFASLGPALMHRAFGLDASLTGGLMLFLLAGSAAISVLALRNLEPERLVRIGAMALAAGTAGLLLAITLHAALLFGAAGLVAGAGFGAGFQGGVRSVLASAHADDRAGLLSLVFLIAYLAMGLPAVAAGWLVVQTGDLDGVAIGFTAAVVALSLLALRGAADEAQLPILE